MLVAYCTGFITVCTVLLFIATILTWRSYQLLRELSPPGPGKHEAEYESAAPRTTSRSYTRSVERYDSGETDAGNGEWTGPVTAYIPSDR